MQNGERMQALGLVWSQVDVPAANKNEDARPAPEPSHFGARLLHDQWAENASRGGIIIGRDVPSRVFMPILRNLVVYEPMQGEVDFRVRLAGAALLRRFGRDVTGSRLSALLDGDSFKRRYIELKSVILRARPLGREVRVSNGSRPPLHYETLDVPALGANLTSRLVLGGFFYPDWKH